MGLNQISIDALLVMEGDTDPTSGGGIAAPLGSIYLIEDGSGVYRKSGAGDTAWTILGGGSGLAQYQVRQIIRR